jgi:hypothetical protein
MRRDLLLIATIAGSLAGLGGDWGSPALAQPPAEAAARGPAVPIQRITMYRSGVASFERRGPVQGNARVQLRFSTDQINDILQSMFVLDLSKGQGRIDGISYGSKEPLAKRLASFGVDINDNPAAGEVLSRLRGTPVRLTLNSGEVSGTIMNVEARPTVFQGSNGTDTAVHNLPWINLLTPQGVRSFNLTDCRGFEILDQALAAELGKALDALAEYRADRTKTVDINLSGEGTREIVVAYVQEAPVWKTSYRLVLPDPGKRAAENAPAQTFTIQGWAIVENTTDEDWRDVTLSLVSGRPVSFRMDLYEPLYVYRPELPVPTVPGVMPRTYAGGQESRRDFDERARDAAPSPAGRPAASRGAQLRYEMRAAEPAMAPASKAISAEDMAGYAAQSQARAVEAGEVFQFEVDHPVTVERQRSAMIPIIHAGVEGRRVSIFNPADASEHPMRGLEITNTAGIQLMPGPISVYDDGVYAGDAQIGHVPKADKRLLAYAVDLDVTQSTKDTGTSEVRRVRIVRGLLEIQSKSVRSVSYTFTNKDQARPRTIITEFPTLQGWELGSGVNPSEQTDLLYRFEVAAAPGKQALQAVTLERVNHESYQLASFDLERLMSYSRQGRASDAVVNAFREAARRHAAIADLNSQAAALEKERAEIDADQARIRQNMGTNTIDRQSDLYTRYVKKLNEQETRLEAIVEALARVRADLTRAQTDLNDYLANLNVE